MQIIKKKENPCLSNPCQNGGKCHPSFESSVAKYSCECSKDYSGLQCQILNQCYPQYCLNGGQCRLNYVGAPYCVCPVGFYGIYCQDCEIKLTLIIKPLQLK
jgi:hypothetical protein